MLAEAIYKSDFILHQRSYLAALLVEPNQLLFSPDKCMQVMELFNFYYNLELFLHHYSQSF